MAVERLALPAGMTPRTPRFPTYTTGALTAVLKRRPSWLTTELAEHMRCELARRQAGESRALWERKWRGIERYREEMEGRERGKNEPAQPFDR